MDPDVQLSHNWNIADLAAKRLLEYEYVQAQNPDSPGTYNRSRFYKEYSNSLQSYFGGSSPFYYSDPKSFTSTWNHVASVISGGYSEDPTYPIAYRVIKVSGGTTTTIEWCGAFWLNNLPMDLNLNVTIAAAGDVPAEARPTVTKYFNMWGGNTTSDFSVARMFFGADGSLQFKRYGANPSGTENRIELTGVSYNIEVVGT